MGWTESGGRRVFEDSGWAITVTRNTAGEQKVVVSPTEVVDAEVDVFDRALHVRGEYRHGNDAVAAVVEIPWAILRELVALRDKTDSTSLEAALKDSRRWNEELRTQLQEICEMSGPGGDGTPRGRVESLLHWKGAFEALNRDVNAAMRTLYTVIVGKPPERRALFGDVVSAAHKLRLEVTEMHRRAQKLEGVEARMERLRKTHAVEMADRLNEAHAIERLWHQRYREGVDMLRKGGIDDRIDGRENYRTGNLDELIRRALTALEEARKRTVK